MTKPNPTKDIRKWFRNEVHASWFTEPVETQVDREEILVVGSLPAEGDDEVAARRAIVEFREHSREERIAIAEKAEVLFGRKVSWAVTYGDLYAPFTTLSVPVMTRLRMDQRRILDTLVGAGVARSRSDAIGWCVRLVAEHEADWLAELQDAVAAVAKVRGKGPA